MVWLLICNGKFLMRGFGAAELWAAPSPLSVASIRKTPPASEDADGVLHVFTSFEVAALE
jgi:hypothetical protein